MTNELLYPKLVVWIFTKVVVHMGETGSAISTSNCLCATGDSQGYDR